MTADVMRREVACGLDVDVTAPTTLEFQVAIAPHPNTEVWEALTFTLDGVAVQAKEISGEHGNRIHQLQVAGGNLQVAYSATVIGQTDHFTPSERFRGFYRAAIPSLHTSRAAAAG